MGCAPAHWLAAHTWTLTQDVEVSRSNATQPGTARHARQRSSCARLHCGCACAGEPWSASRATTARRITSAGTLALALAAQPCRLGPAEQQLVPLFFCHRPILGIASCARCVPRPGARRSFIRNRNRSAAAETARAFVAPRHHHGRRSSSNALAEGPHRCPESQRDHRKTSTSLRPARAREEAPSTPAPSKPSTPPFRR